MLGLLLNMHAHSCSDLSNITQCTAPEGGFCNEPNECICHQGYAGEHCEVGKSQQQCISIATPLII